MCQFVDITNEVIEFMEREGFDFLELPDGTICFSSADQTISTIIDLEDYVLSSQEGRELQIRFNPLQHASKFAKLI